MALIGLRDFVVVELEKDDKTGATYAKEVKKLTGARTTNVSPQLAEGSLHGDDQLLENEASVSSLEVSIELASLTLEEEAFLLGQEYKNGVITENKDANPPNVALGFKAPKSKTGGGGFRMVWLTKGSAKPTDESNQTKEDNIEFQVPSLDFVFTPRIADGVFRIKADTNDEGAPTPDAFFTPDYLSGTNVGE